MDVAASIVFVLMVVLCVFIHLAQLARFYFALLVRMLWSLFSACWPLPHRFSGSWDPILTLETSWSTVNFCSSWKLLTCSLYSAVFAGKSDSHFLGHEGLLLSSLDLLADVVSPLMTQSAYGTDPLEFLDLSGAPSGFSKYICFRTQDSAKVGTVWVVGVHSGQGGYYLCAWGVRHSMAGTTCMLRVCMRCSATIPVHTAGWCPSVFYSPPRESHTSNKHSWTIVAISFTVTQCQCGSPVGVILPVIIFFYILFELPSSGCMLNLCIVSSSISLSALYAGLGSGALRVPCAAAWPRDGTVQLMADI